MTQRPVVLEIPASSAYLTLVRSAASAVCARLDYPVDQLDDFALACGEAAALLLQDAVIGSTIRVCFEPETPGEDVAAGVFVTLTARTQSGRIPRDNTFSWTVLTSLVDQIRAAYTGGEVQLYLTSHRALGGAA